MSRIFISHSSQDNFAAAAIREWLAAEGWDDVFLDFDPDKGIAAGERWEHALHAAAARCEAVVCLVSAAWLASGWCRREYALARSLNKRLFALLVDRSRSIDDLPPELMGTWQVVDLAHGQDMWTVHARPPGMEAGEEIVFAREGLRRLRRGLEKAGLDPSFFAWPPAADPDRAPYRGLLPLEAEDSGIFFGRDAPIVEAIDTLRGMRAGAPPRLAIILGASGAGKSSFLRAGLLPRLVRDDIHFLPLAPIRPERHALTGDGGLLGSLAGALPDVPRDDLAAAIRSGAGALRPLLADLTRRARDRQIDVGGGTQPPAVVIAIDQAEELFRGDGAVEGARLLDLLRELTASDDPAVIVVFAIRSDAYNALEHARSLEGLPQTALPLLPMPRGAFKEVIEGPARRTVEAGGKLAIEPQLTQRLLDDIESGAGSDALPLLAFTLGQLYLGRQGPGLLRLDEYETSGRTRGAIDAAVARALRRADADSRIPPDPAARLALLRRGLIPWLAGIDPETKTARRAIARRSDIPPEAAPLIDLLVEERLLATDSTLVRDADTGVEHRLATIEPAHEALLRQWSLLEGWLAEDFAILATLEAVQRAARDWDANARADSWLAHQGERLSEAEEIDLRPDIAAKLDPLDRLYLAGCRRRDDAVVAEAEQRRVEREAEQARQLADAQALAAADRRTTQRTRVGLAAALVLAAAAGAFGVYAQHERATAQRTLTAATDTANTLIFDLARKFRDVTGMPAGMVQSIFDRALKLQSDLIGSGQTSDALLTSQASALDAASATLITVGDTKGAATAASRSIAIWKRLLASNPHDAALQRGLGSALVSLGDADMLAGDQPAALAAFEQSLGVDRAIGAADTRDATAENAMGVALQRIGDAKSRAGDRQGGLAAYEESLTLFRHLAQGDTNRDALSEIAHGLDRIAAIKREIGDRAGTAAALDEDLRIRRIVARDKTDAVAQRDLAWTLSTIGETKQIAGDLAGAKAAYEESLDLRRALAADTSNKRAQRDFAESLMRIADIDHSTGDLAGAKAAIDESIKIARRFARDKTNGEAQRNLAEALQTEGDVDIEAGDLAAALATYQEALGIFRAQARNRHDPTTQRDLALILYSLGETKAASGDRVGALAAYEESLAIRRDAAKDAGNREAQRDLAIGLDKIGDMTLAGGDAAGALTYYNEDLAITRKLASDPANAEAQRDLSLSLVKIGDAKVAQRDGPGAMAAYAEALAIRRRLAKDATRTSAPRDLAAILAKIGDLDLNTGDTSGGLAAFDECLGLLRGLDGGKTDPRSQKELAGISQLVGDMKLKAGDKDGARAAFEAGLDALRGIAARDPTNTAVQQKLVATMNNIGSLKLDAGDTAGALAAFEASLPGARGLATNDEGKLDLTLILDNIGIAERDLGRFKDAQAAFEESLRLRQDLATRGSADATSNLAVSLDHLGDDLLDEQAFGAAFDRYKASIALRQKLLAGGADPVGMRRDIRSDARQIGSISYRLLLVRDFQGALDAADVALGLAPDLLWIATNKAHALMFLGRTDEARALYLAHRGETAQKGQSWAESVRSDFAAFRKLGMTSPLMAEIERELDAPEGK